MGSALCNKIGEHPLGAPQNRRTYVICLIPVQKLPRESVQAPPSEFVSHEASVCRYSRRFLPIRRLDKKAVFGQRPRWFGYACRLLGVDGLSIG